MDNKDEAFARQLDLLARAYPGRLTLTLEEACAALSTKIKTFRHRRERGEEPFPVRFVGGRLVARVDDVARAAVELPGKRVPSGRPRRARATPVEKVVEPPRRGRPSRKEEREAERLGVSVAELRRRRAGGEPR